MELAGSSAAFSDGVNHVGVSNAGTLRVTGPNQAVGTIDLDGLTLVTGAGQLTATHVRQGLISISGSNAKASIRPNGTAAGVSVLDGIEISLGGRLDLNDNDLIISATAVTKNAIHNAMKSHITSAQNGIDANFITKWDGPGITSSFARTSNVATGFDLIGLGVIRNSDIDITTGLPGSAYTTFSGQPVTPDDVLVKYTYIGDGNLDGLVSFDDYVGMDNAFFGLIPNLGWATGDINFDGVINFDDYTVVDQAFFFQGAPLAHAEVAAVPEPGTWLLAALALASLIYVSRRTTGAKNRRPLAELRFCVLLVGVLWLQGEPAMADTVSLLPTRDNTLYEDPRAD